MIHTAWLVSGIAIGMALAALQRHPRRALGLIPPALMFLAAVLGWTAWTEQITPLLAGLIGVGLGVVNGACLFTRLGLVRHGGNPLELVAAVLGLGLLNGVVIFCMSRAATWYAAGLVGVVALASWYFYYRETIEQFLECVIWPIYRIRASGPGLRACPPTGPLLVVANHSAWMDPVWLAKVLPRRLTPMMTSSFYDLPGLRWLMVYVVGAIRVQDSEYRREAPELDLAVAALDRGETVVIFPEGRLRRSSEMLLRQFGQGAWHILKQRPQTPVIACWIEGGFGSFMSYYNGPPTRNKRMDWWRPIQVVVGKPQILSDDVLADDRSTRSHLMQSCLSGREVLGLPAQLSPMQDAEAKTMPQQPPAT